MKYLISPVDYGLQNPRIDGFRKLMEVNGRAAEVYVVSLDCFSYFKNNGSFPDDFRDELKTAVDSLLQRWPGYFLAVRRGYVVPGIDNPPGPRFHGATSDDEVFSNIEALFKFAIDNKYDESPKSQIAAFFHPFVGPEKYSEENSDKSFVSYGGYAVSQGETRQEVYAVYGLNEGVQSLTADRYVVDGQNGRYFITTKEVPQKSKMLCPTNNSPAETFNVPVDKQFDQILSDSELLEVARVVQELSIKYGAQRVEFSVNKQGLFFNEVADYWKEESKNENRDVNVKGTIKVINSLKDFNKLSIVSGDDLRSGKIIVEVGRNIIKNRDYDVLGALAAWKDDLFVLYPGVAATQHAMRVLTDKGHKAFLIGNQEFDDGDETQIIVSGGKVRVTNLSRTQNQKYVSLWDASLLGVELCGGKADRLSKLKILGYQVPHGAVCTSLLFDDILGYIGFKSPVEIKDFKEIYRKINTSDKKLITKINNLINDYVESKNHYSVRSSATIEDDSMDSMAGMFETYLNVTGSDLGAKVLEVVKSSFTEKIINHIKEKPELIKKLKMAVVLQRMVNARVAGVIFGAKTQTGNLDIVEIEAKTGLGEGIVSGDAENIEQFKFSRSDRRIIEQTDKGILSPSEGKALFMLSERLRSEFNDTPQDIEWAIDMDGQIWVLQSRDLYLNK